MFGGFPKLFDRAFFIGYFLPAFLLVVGLGANLFAFGYIDEKFIHFVAKKSTAAHALGATISLVFIWLFSIFLMAFNRPIIRLLEGYGELNPFRMLLPWQQRKFNAQAKPHLRKLQNVLDARRHGVPETDQFYELGVWRAARDFPERLDLVLPTRLGNVMRAYERYSDVVYEIEAIVLWPRLFMIIPEEARDRIRESEGLFHFSINMQSAEETVARPCCFDPVGSERQLMEQLDYNLFVALVCRVVAGTGFGRRASRLHRSECPVSGIELKRRRPGRAKSLGGTTPRHRC